MVDMKDRVIKIIDRGSNTDVATDLAAYFTKTELEEIAYALNHIRTNHPEKMGINPRIKT